MKYYQQGDVILKQVQELPAGLELLQKTDKILQRGETTGHKHQFDAGAAVSLYTFPAAGPMAGMRIATHDGVTYIHVEHPAALRHEEHKPITIDPGVYQLDLVREFDYESLETRRVVD